MTAAVAVAAGSAEPVGGAGPAKDPARRRGPGRPREEGHDERILQAALGLIDEGRPITVAAVVEVSGVSRAALYRRWGSLTDLVAAALDHGRAEIEIPLDGDLKQSIIDVYFARSRAARGAAYPERRFRLRMQLVLADRNLQRTYWRAHVRRRRRGLEHALRAGIEHGVLRADLDIDASIDLINGALYYQYVVRGCAFDDPEAHARTREAFETAWRGMVA